MLPDKPSELIKAALLDLRRCEYDPRYEIFMLDWHVPGTVNGKRPHLCYVCMAGAVMAKTLASDINKDIMPNSYRKNRIEKKLLAINEFRRGRVFEGLAYLGMQESKIPNRKIVEYKDDKESFYSEMNVLSTVLEQAML